MTEKDLYITVFWGYRPATYRTCIAQLLGFLVKLKGKYPAFFSEWYEKEATQEKTLAKKVNFTYESVKSTLSLPSEPDFPYDEDSEPVWPHVTLYSNGKLPPEEMTLEASIGLGDGAEKMIHPNIIQINIPRVGPIYDFFYDKENILDLLGLTTDYWVPDRIEVNNSAIMDFLSTGWDAISRAIDEAE